jgi:hypothetical protein
VPELRHSRFSPLAILTIASVLMFFGVAGGQVFAAFQTKAKATTYVAPSTPDEQAVGGASWQQEMMLLGMATSTDPGTTDGTDPINMIAPEVLAQLIGAYQGLQEAGTYSTTTAAGAAAQIAPNVRANVVYRPYDISEISIDSDSSYARMLSYRTDLQEALKPLLDNKRAEFEIYGQYVATGDKGYLRQLQTAALNYSTAAVSAAHITVPSDIAETHLEIVNALAQFSATLNAMVAHADDPIASVALLRNYNDSETAVVNSFDKLAHYERMKQP